MTPGCVCVLQASELEIYSLGSQILGMVGERKVLRIMSTVIIPHLKHGLVGSGVLDEIVIVA